MAVTPCILQLLKLMLSIAPFISFGAWFKFQVPSMATCWMLLLFLSVHHVQKKRRRIGSSQPTLLSVHRCVIVGSLQVVYRLPTATGVTISQAQPRAAALQDSDLYVEVDKLDSYTQILPELTRMFAKGAVEAELAQFLIALTLTMVSLAVWLGDYSKMSCWPFLP